MHQASELERHLDCRAGRDDGSWQQLVYELADTPTLAQLADRNVPLKSHRVDAEAWRQITKLVIDLRGANIELSPRLPHPTTEIGLELGL